MIPNISQNVLEVVTNKKKYALTWFSKYCGQSSEQQYLICSWRLSNSSVFETRRHPSRTRHNRTVLGQESLLRTQNEATTRKQLSNVMEIELKVRSASERVSTARTPSKTAAGECWEDHHLN